MIAVRRASERLPTGSPPYRWSTFDPHAAHPSLRGVGALEVLDEERLGASTLDAPGRDAERLTYVVSGGLTALDPAGRPAFLRSDRFRQFVELAPRAGTLAPRPPGVRVFQLGFRGDQRGHLPSSARQLVTYEERLDRWLLALSLGVEARIFSSSLSEGRALELSLDATHAAWLQVVAGEVTIDELTLRAGDGVLIKALPSVSIRARAESELLLIEVVDEHDELLWNGD